jgi:hypothetical protein
MGPAGEQNIHQWFLLAEANTANGRYRCVEVVLLNRGLDCGKHLARAGRQAARGGSDGYTRHGWIKQFHPRFFEGFQLRVKRNGRL